MSTGVLGDPLPLRDLNPSKTTTWFSTTKNWELGPAGPIPSESARVACSLQAKPEDFETSKGLPMTSPGQMEGKINVHLKPSLDTQCGPVKLKTMKSSQRPIKAWGSQRVSDSWSWVIPPRTGKQAETKSEEGSTLIFTMWMEPWVGFFSVCVFYKHTYSRCSPVK